MINYQATKSRITAFIFKIGTLPTSPSMHTIARPIMCVFVFTAARFVICFYVCTCVFLFIRVPLCLCEYARVLVCIWIGLHLLIHYRASKGKMRWAGAYAHAGSLSGNIHQQFISDQLGMAYQMNANIHPTSSTQITTQHPAHHLLFRNLNY